MTTSVVFQCGVYPATLEAYWRRRRGKSIAWNSDRSFRNSDVRQQESAVGINKRRQRGQNLPQAAGRGMKDSKSPNAAARWLSLVPLVFFDRQACAAVPHHSLSDNRMSRDSDQSRRRGAALSIISTALHGPYRCRRGLELSSFTARHQMTGSGAGCRLSHTH
jgi:hypothetical protein